MKRKPKKLELSRETIVKLTSEDLRRVGAAAGVGSAMLNCDTWDGHCDPKKPPA